MKNQIITSTKNINKFVNINAYILNEVFEKLVNNNMKDCSTNKTASNIMAKFVKVLADIEVYAKSEHCKTKHIYKHTYIMYKTFTCIKKNVEMCDKEKKVVKTILTYLHCVVNLIRKIECLTDSDTNISFSIKDYCNDEKSDIEICHDNSYNCIDQPITCNNVCDNKDTMAESINKLKCIYDMFNLLKVITVMLEKYFTDQLNIVNNYSPSEIISQTDYDMNYKLIDIYSAQFIGIAQKHCGDLFDLTSTVIDVVVNINHKHNSQIVLCKIDNIITSVELMDAVKTFLIQVGNTHSICKYITFGETYADASVIFKNNIDNISKITRALDSNQKLIVEHLATIHNFIKYNILK